MTSETALRRTKNPSLSQRNLDSSETTEELSAFDLIAVEALDASYNQNTIHFVRKAQRYYSQKFNTPLPTVRKMDLAEVLQDYYEHNFDTLMETQDGRERLYEIFIDLIKPEHAENEKELIEKFAKDADKAEKERLRTGQGLMDYLRGELRKSTKTLSPDFKVVDKKKKAPLMKTEPPKEQPLPDAPPPQEEKSLEEEEVNISFEEETPQFTRDEILEMRDGDLEKLHNKKGE